MILAILLSFLHAGAGQTRMDQNHLRIGVLIPNSAPLVQDSDTLGIVNVDSSGPTVRITRKPTSGSPITEKAGVIASYQRKSSRYDGRLIDSASSILENGRWFFRADFRQRIRDRGYYMMGLWSGRGSEGHEIICLLDSSAAVQSAEKVDQFMQQLRWRDDP